MDINKRIAEIKNRVKFLTSHFPYHDEEINFLTVAYLAFTLLDPTIEDLIDKVLVSTFLLLTDKTVYDELYSLDPDYAKEIKEYIENSTGTCEGYRYVFGNELSYEPFIIITRNRKDMNEMLDNITHELKHSINDILPNIHDGFFYRGLALFWRYSSFGDCLDEGFNSLLSAIYVQIITALKKYTIEDPGIAHIIYSLEENDYVAYTYGKIVDANYDIFASKTCFWPLYNASLYKDMDNLGSVIESVFNYSLSFEEWVETLDRQDPKELERIDKLIVRERVKEELVLPKI